MGQHYDEQSVNMLFGVGAVFFLAFVLLLSLLMMIAMYKIYKKAGREDAWAAFIPIYSTFVLIDIIKRPWWQFFMYMIPFYGFYLSVVDLNRLSKFFGKASEFTVGLFFLPMVFVPILGFGPAQYNPNALPDLREK